jgi:hypothetical protein
VEDEKYVPHTLYLELKEGKNVPHTLYLEVEDEKIPHTLCIWRWRRRKCPTYFVYRGGG